MPRAVFPRPEHILRSRTRARLSITAGMATIAGLTVRQGETYRWSFVWAERGADGSNVPKDLTGCTARMQVREKYGTEVLVDLTTENGGIVLGEEPGQFRITMTAEQTDAMGVTNNARRPRTQALYDLELTYPSTDVRRVLEGSVTIRPNITRGVA